MHAKALKKKVEEQARSLRRAKIAIFVLCLFDLFLINMFLSTR